MSLEEVMNNITILNEMTRFNNCVFACVIGIILIVGSVRLFIKDSESCPRPMCVIFIIVGGFWALFGGYEYAKRPEIIRLQIVSETVSEQQLAEYFELSNVSIGDGKIVCDIEPKYDYFNPEKNYYNEVRAVLREVKEEQQ